LYSASPSHWAYHSEGSLSPLASVSPKFVLKFWSLQKQPAIVSMPSHYPQKYQGNTAETGALNWGMSSDQKSLKVKEDHG
jgi:hypothetical protein